jgi:uncharacterized linocin/CFP29 family protein
MNHLLRGNAPITDERWSEIDAEARERLTTALAGRTLVDFDGPKGWQYSATNLGRTEVVTATPFDGLEATQRRVLPLVELRAPFAVSRKELAAGDRGAADVDFDDLDEAAMRIARAENVAVFHGWAKAAIAGITEATSHAQVKLGKGFDTYPKHVAKAVQLLLTSGIEGPYAIALGSDAWTGVVETTEHGGYPLLDHLRNILGGPIVWAPGVEGAVVLSQRGEDFLFESGQDLSVGYSHHDADEVHLYIEESFSFRVATPEAAVALR